VKDKTYSERDAQAESALKFLNQEQYISVNTLKGSLVGFSSSHALFYFLFFYFFFFFSYQKRVKFIIFFFTFHSQ
jgi:hypothetical protein